MLARLYGIERFLRRNNDGPRRSSSIEAVWQAAAPNRAALLTSFDPVMLENDELVRRVLPHRPPIAICTAWAQVRASSMAKNHYRGAALVIAVAGLLAVIWLLLFGGPALLNAHRDYSALVALLVYVGVPIVVAWGGPRLWRFIVPGEADHE